MKMIKRKNKKIDKDDLGFQEEILQEGFTEEPLEGNLIKSFSFTDEAPSK